MSGAELGVILILLAAISCAAAASMKKDLSRINTNTSLDLVRVLKEDLRKNNDDYKDVKEPSDTDIKNPYLNEDTVTSEPEVKDRKSLDFARRHFDNKFKSDDKKKPLVTIPRSPPPTTKSQDKHMLHDKDAKKDDNITTLQSHDNIFKTKEKYIKSDEKFLKSHRKNMPTNNKESMLHDVKKRKDDLEIWKPTKKVNNKNAMLHDKQMKAIDNKLKQQDTKAVDKKSKPPNRTPVGKKTMDWMKVSSERELFGPTDNKVTKNLRNESKGFVTTTATSPDARRKRLKYDKLHRLLDKEGLLNKFLRKGPSERDVERGVERGDTRNRAFEIESGPEPPPVAETLSTEELDMLPATGERIETLKRKGRFCFRHILLPEGPKYDSRGRVYEPAHAAKLSHRNFAHTRKPRQVLPKCCNCCKKSVLGCE